MSIWNSIEVYKEYQDHRGTETSRSQLVKTISDNFGDKLIVLSSPGFASVLAFHTPAIKLLKLVRDDEEDNIKSSIKQLAETIREESKAINLNKSKYQINIYSCTAVAAASDRMLQLLDSVSPKLLNTLPALLIGNMIIAAVRSYLTELQIVLGVVLRSS